MRSCALPIIGFVLMALLSLSYGQAPAPSPTSDGELIFFCKTHNSFLLGLV